MLLGKLPMEAELYEKQLGLMYAVLHGVVQRQLACSFDKWSTVFFYCIVKLFKYTENMVYRRIIYGAVSIRSQRSERDWNVQFQANGYLFSGRTVDATCQ